MIQGIGIDIVELKRMERNVTQPRFIARVLTPKEQAQLENFPSEKRKLEYLAGRFACKEAYAKALGTGFTGVSFQELEILNDEKGAPQFTKHPFSGHAWVSLSHSDQWAVAQVILEK